MIGPPIYKIMFSLVRSNHDYVTHVANGWAYYCILFEYCNKEKQFQTNYEIYFMKNHLSSTLIVNVCFIKNSCVCW